MKTRYIENFLYYLFGERYYLLLKENEEERKEEMNGENYHQPLIYLIL